MFNRLTSLLHKSDKDVRSRRSRPASLRRRRVWRPSAAELLEDRRVPAVVFAPVMGAETVVENNGAHAGSV
jgi:hypothetical protein